ncbi:hypothetical protein P280DRAFT_475538 [Massarina eburnea CBS 473.64]|uniref:Uncharacterized protein n=1 Tax=Massarina eburnea CBS 473.64 TaxID=1395130 RepID=A0A6A6SJ59_9PLEO|nr:hypothetical protein P280DRAFT_475538 [Massarina eburnea CBS 473.64]
MKIALLITVLASLLFSAYAWGTVTLSIYPSLVTLDGLGDQREVIDLKAEIFTTLYKLCPAADISDKDPSTGKIWRHCDGAVTPIYSKKGNPTNLTVRVTGAGWRDDNPVIFESMANIVSNTFSGFQKSQTNKHEIPNKLTLQSGLSGENYLNVELLANKGWFKAGLMDAGTCGVMMNHGLKATDLEMAMFHQRLAGGSTTRRVHCLNYEGQEYV